MMNGKAEKLNVPPWQKYIEKSDIPGSVCACVSVCVSVHTCKHVLTTVCYWMEPELLLCVS